MIVFLFLSFWNLLNRPKEVNGRQQQIIIFADFSSSQEKRKEKILSLYIVFFY